MEETYLWKIDNQQKEEALQHDIDTDILIIGGGLTGISVAFALKDQNQKIVVVDQNQCGHGVTLRTTGKLTFLQDNIYSKLEKIYGINTAKLYFKSQKDAIKIVKQNIQKYNIVCNFEEVDSYLFVTKEKNLNKLKKEKDILSSFCKVTDVNNLPIDFPIKKAIKVTGTAIFHPLKYLLALKDICKKTGIAFYEDTLVQNIIPQDRHYIVSANNHFIKAKKVVICCHYPFFILPFGIPFKTYLEKSYIAACKVDNNKKFSAINLDDEVYSFRYYQHNDNKYFLYLSQTTRLTDEINSLKQSNELKNKVQQDINSKYDYLWSNYDLMTSDHLPYIGKLKNKYSNLFLATGYNTWGMTNASLAGKIIADLILGKENPYISLFDPTRRLNSIMVVNDLVDNFKTAKSFIQTKLKKNYSFYPPNVKVTKRKGKTCGVYIDEKGMEHVVFNLCPHMKCSLIFNPITTSWDCPCHGSRFDIDGNILKGPSSYDIKIR